MALSVLDPHPLGENNPVTLRTFAALPAAGSWDADPTVVECAGFWWCRLFVAYDPHDQAVDPSLEYRYEISPHSADEDVDVPQCEWVHSTVYVPNEIVAWKVTRSDVQQETFIFTPESSGLETFIGPPIHLAGCIERLRIYCRERGDQDNPGECGVLGVFYREG